MLSFPRAGRANQGDDRRLGIDPVESPKRVLILPGLVGINATNVHRTGNRDEISARIVLFKHSPGRVRPKDYSVRIAKTLFDQSNWRPGLP